MISLFSRSMMLAVRPAATAPEGSKHGKRFRGTLHAASGTYIGCHPGRGVLRSYFRGAT